MGDEEDAEDTQNQPVLQYQSYNPNTGVFKMEATPIALTSNYSPYEAVTVEKRERLDHCQSSSSSAYLKGGENIYQEIRSTGAPRGKSSSSSDSLAHHSRNSAMVLGAAASSATSTRHQQQQQSMGTKQVGTKDKGVVMEASRSAEEGGGGGRERRKKDQLPSRMAGGETSDSSIGDSLFSGSNPRRYFGSTDSCRLLDSDGQQRCMERFNYYSEDNSNYCRQCDCSSSYFSSDFDENGGGGGGGVGGCGYQPGNSGSGKQSTTGGIKHQQQLIEDSYYDYPKKSGSNSNSAGKCDPRHSSSSGYREDLFMRCAPREGGPNEKREVATGTTKAEQHKSKRNAKKKYYYDDGDDAKDVVMMIPNEVAYNLSYGMIRRENKPGESHRDVTNSTSHELPRCQERQKDEFEEPAYAEIKSLLPGDEDNDNDNEDNTNELVRETGAKPKKKSTTSTRNEGSPGMQMKKKQKSHTQPIYASPVKVARRMVVVELNADDDVDDAGGSLGLKCDTQRGGKDKVVEERETVNLVAVKENLSHDEGVLLISGGGEKIRGIDGGGDLGEGSEVSSFKVRKMGFLFH